MCQVQLKVNFSSNLLSIHAFLSTFYATDYSTLVCAQCHSDVPWLPPVISLTVPVTTNMNQSIVKKIPVQTSTTYTSYIKAAMVAFKYKEDLSALPVLIYALSQLPRPNGHHFKNSVIVPMPTTARRLRKRGFDPVTILSYFLSQHWNIPLWHGVIRVDNTQSQQGLTRIERLSNLINAFDVKELPPVHNLILFDDVMTTGASLMSLSHTLLATDKHLKLSAYAIAHGN